MFYAFPPFSILLHVIKKIEYDGATGTYLANSGIVSFVAQAATSRATDATLAQRHCHTPIQARAASAGAQAPIDGLSLVCGVRSSGEAAQNSLPT